MRPLFLALFLLLCACGTRPDAAPPATVPALDLPRYMGRWYELAKYPNRFQRHCIAETTAQYSLLPDGGVEVVNRCATLDGSFDQAVGRAELVGPGPARLRVRFAPRWLGWLSFVWGDYWVIELDPDYSLAAVGDPSRQYLWVLSRTPSIEPQRYDRLLEMLRGQGYDVARLEKTRQNAAGGV